MKDSFKTGLMQNGGITGIPDYNLATLPDRFSTEGQHHLTTTTTTTTNSSPQHQAA
jgi:hypothetical protein